MQIVNFKLEEHIVRKVDSVLRDNHFNNRTEFIRQAIRDKLEELELKSALKRAAELKGAAKRKTSDRELRDIREQVIRRYIPQASEP